MMFIFICAIIMQPSVVLLKYQHVVPFLMDFLHYRPTDIIQFLVTEDDQDWLSIVKRTMKQSEANVKVQALTTKDTESADEVMDIDTVQKRIIVLPEIPENLSWIGKIISSNPFIYPRILIFTTKSSESDEDFKRIQSEILFAQLNEIMILKFTKGGYSIYESYQTDETTPLITHRIGAWKTANLEDNLILQKQKLDLPIVDVSYRRLNFHGKFIRCLSERSVPPQSTYKKDTKQFKGRMHSIMEDISSYSNFSYECFPHDEENFGEQINGKWIGLLGKLVNNATDLVIAPVDRSPQRNRYIDYPLALEESRYEAILKKPMKLHSWENYTMEMSSRCWVACVVTLILLTWIFVVSSNSLASVKINFSDAFLIGICSLTTGYENGSFRERSSIRIILFVMHLFSFIVVTHYTSFLISTFTTMEKKVPFHTIEKLLEDGSYRVGMAPGSALEEFLNFTDVPKYKKLLAKIRSSIAVDEDTDSQLKDAKILTTTLVHFGDQSMTQYLARHDCRVYAMKETIKTFDLGFAFRKNVLPMKVVSNQILRLKESGIVTRYQSASMRSSIDCFQKEYYQPVEWKEAFSAFVFLTSFIIISLIILMLENVYKMYQ